VKRRLLAIAAALMLVAAPVTAAPSPEDVVADVTTAVDTAITEMVQAAQASQTSLWQVPYRTIADIDRIIDEGLVAVEALTVPECQQRWIDTVRVALILLDETFEVVGRAAGQPDTIDQEMVSAFSGGYTLLVVVAPLLHDTADCQPDPDVT